MARLISCNNLYQGSGVTLVNSAGANGVPNASKSNAQVAKTYNNAKINTEAYDGRAQNNLYNVNLGDGNNTLVAKNMMWVRAENAPNNSHTGLYNISTGSGNDLIDLDRSGYHELRTGAGNDTVKMHNSGGKHLDLGAGDDVLSVSGNFDEISDDELSQKTGVTGVVDGGAGNDTLNIDGSFTLTLTNGAYVMMNDGTTRTVISNSDFANIKSWHGNINGKMQAGEPRYDRKGKLLNKPFNIKNFEAINIVCFTAGTRICTPKGEVPIESLSEGDEVVTRRGVKTVKWIGKRRLDSVDLAYNPNILPIRIPAGALGNGLPERDVSFSPQHRILIRSCIAQEMFGTKDILVAAKQLVGYNGIDVDASVREVQYVHIMLEDHELVTVEGIEAETLYPGKQALQFLSEHAIKELREIFPNFDEIAENPEMIPMAAPCVKGREARALTARHIRQNMPMMA